MTSSLFKLDWVEMLLLDSSETNGTIGKKFKIKGSIYYLLYCWILAIKWNRT